MISDILSDPEARRLGFGPNSILRMDRPAAVKTGTTSNFHDNWTIGYTPNLVVGVWSGNTDYQPMREVNGLTGAAPIWHEFMRAVLAGSPQMPFTRPAGLELAEVCALSGGIPTDACPYRKLEWFIPGSKAAIIRWWNGASACLDLSNPKAQAWYKTKLDYLVKEYGVDGFKFDAGDARFYADGVVSWQRDITPNDHTRFFAEFGLNYPLNEYRASWKMAGLPLAQRLRDKGHKWEDLAKLIPDQMSQSVMGYAYTCPDMIGGGEYRSFLNAASHR